MLATLLALFSLKDSAPLRPQILNGFDLEHCAVALSPDCSAVLTNARGLNAIRTGLACVLEEEEVRFSNLHVRSYCEYLHFKCTLARACATHCICPAVSMWLACL